MKQLILSALIFTSAVAQSPKDVVRQGTNDARIPTPESVLKYTVGDRFSDYHSLNKYFEILTSSSDRARRIVYGSSVEGRTLQALVISSPRNLARIDDIRRQNKKLTDPRTLSSKEELRSIASSLPVIVYLSYGVHGNEASSPEAAMLVAYRLCAGTDDQITVLMENAVIIIDPNVNPDGRERYVQWVNSVLGPSPNLHPFSLEHTEQWPGGRSNHYLFDLNRDLSWQTQPETRQRVLFYREWMPHVHVDYHEMDYTSTYFFFPAALPVHQALPPEVVKWGKIFGKGNADAFDRHNIPYYVGEHFDMFYPGYGDSWPTFNGSIGMTYEQAGGSRGGLAVRKPNGQILTLRDRARNHFITSIATIETSVKNRKERIEDFAKFWETALQSSSPTKGYIISSDQDPTRITPLVALLLRQGIEVYRLSAAASLQVKEYFQPKTVSKTMPAGSLFIPIQQPQSRLAQALLEPVTAVSDTFFYDISAWSLPVASGLKGWISYSPLPTTSEKVQSATIPPGQLIGGRKAFAYLIPWNRHGAIPMVWKLLEKGYSLSVARRPFKITDRHFSAGTIVAFSGSNTDSLATDLEEGCRTYGVDVYAYSSGLTDQGITLGSNYVAPIKRSSIALAVGSPVSSSDYGELWHLFERELGIPFTAVRATDLADIDLGKFDVVILPDGGNYQSVFDSAKVDRLRRWIQSGGVLIGIEGGAQFLTKSRSGLTQAMLRAEKKEDEKSKEEKEQEKAKKELAKRMTLFEKEERARLDRIPGTIFTVVVDTTHPTGFGMSPTIQVFKSDATPIELTEIGHSVARYSKDSVQTSGYASRERAQKLAEAAYIQDFRIGRGRAILFSENITFRRFWSGLEKLLLNTILFLPQPD
jgi:hypothetical protein